MKRFRSLFSSVLALLLSVNLMLGATWHDHAGHSPASHAEVALEPACHDHAKDLHAGHGHSHAGHGQGAKADRVAQAPGWSSSSSGDGHPDDCAVCRFLGQSSAPPRGVSLECSQPIVSAFGHQTTTSPESRSQRRQQSRAPPAVS